MFEQQTSATAVSAKPPIEFIANDIIGSLPRTKSGNLLVVIIIDWYSKLNSAIPAPKGTSTLGDHICLKNC